MFAQFLYLIKGWKSLRNYSSFNTALVLKRHYMIPVDATCAEITSSMISLKLRTFDLYPFFTLNKKRIGIYFVKARAADNPMLLYLKFSPCMCSIHNSIFLLSGVFTAKTYNKYHFLTPLKFLLLTRIQRPIISNLVVIAYNWLNEK